jgi:hypothetical protein
VAFVEDWSPLYASFQIFMHSGGEFMGLGTGPEAHVGVIRVMLYNHGRNPRANTSLGLDLSNGFDPASIRPIDGFALAINQTRVGRTVRLFSPRC